MSNETISGHQSDQLLIEKNLYMARLASHPESIDPIMDSMREITAKMQPGTPLSASDHAGLEQVSRQIAHYLINQDPVRSFTQESLDAQVTAHLSASYGKDKMVRTTFRQTMAILGIAGGVYVAGFLGGIILSFPNPFLLGVMPAIISIYLGIAWLFISSLKTFSPALQQAYAWISFGLLALGVGAALWIPYSMFEDVYYMPPFRYGIAILCIAVTFVVTYLGMRKFAKALSLNSVPTYWWFVAIVTVTACAGVTQIPHADVPEAEYLNSSLIGYTVIFVLGSFISVMAYQIMGRLTHAYAQAMGWFGAGYFWATAMTVPVMALILKTGLGFSPKILGIGCLFAVAGFMLMVSGYKFKRSSGAS